ncbi:hypothetical protein CN284_26915 [Bacillus cereus]|nr:hypothetical protein CN284_26915 [Bacillus cereus]
MNKIGYKEVIKLFSENAMNLKGKKYFYGDDYNLETIIVGEIGGDIAKSPAEIIYSDLYTYFEVFQLTGSFFTLDIAEGGESGGELLLRVICDYENFEDEREIFITNVEVRNFI